MTSSKYHNKNLISLFQKKDCKLCANGEDRFKCRVHVPKHPVDSAGILALCEDKTKPILLTKAKASVCHILIIVLFNFFTQFLNRTWLSMWDIRSTKSKILQAFVSCAKGFRTELGKLVENNCTFIMIVKLWMRWIPRR
jgi:hypothetical protein